MACTVVVACSSSENANSGPPASEGGGDGGAHHVGGNTSGLGGSLVLENNGKDVLTVTKDGAFTFATPLASGSTYEVTAVKQPNGQTCTIANGTGTVGATDVTNVAVSCAEDVFSVGGTVSGLSGTLVLSNNGADDLTLSANGAFTFAKRVPVGGEYEVTVRTQPAGQICAVANGSGVASANVTGVSITCAPAYAVGGTVSGLTGTLVLHNNGGDPVTVNADGPFTFASPLLSNTAYAVTVGTQPQNQLCTVENGSGTMGSVAVTDVTVTCAPTHDVGGTLSGLVAGAVVLQINGGGDLSRAANGPFTFGSPLVEGASYHVSVLKNPAGQVCEVTGADGTIAGGDVSNVAVACRLLAVVINEIYARPATGAAGDTNGDGVRDGTQDQFVEIINNEAFPVDVGNWVIRAGTGSAPKFTFPAATSLPAGGRAVVFGGGTPTGGFAGAQTFTCSAASGLALTNEPSSPFSVRLESAESAGLVLDTFTYGDDPNNAQSSFQPFKSRCATNSKNVLTDYCSQVRSPEGTGPFVKHTDVSGSAGILWSPGVAASGAIVKVNPLLSDPAVGAMNATVKNVDVQLNMYANVADFNNTSLRLYASPCSAPANEITAFSSIDAIVQGTHNGDGSRARLLPATNLAYATTHCVSVATSLRSANLTPLASAVAYEFKTRAAASAPAATVVISEYGGCRTASTGTGTTCGGSSADDEFVELYNPTNAPVDVAGWFLQRRTAGGSTSLPNCTTLPDGAVIPSGGFYLIGAKGYTPSHYPGAPVADFKSDGSLIGGGSESLVLRKGGTCTSTTGVIDAVSAGTSATPITDSLSSLQLPAFPTPPADGQSLERKACFDSTGDANAAGGLLPGGGHEAQGNSERFGASNADWVLRAAPSPQNTTSVAETRTCP